MEEKEPSFTAGWNVNWYSHYGKQGRGSSKIVWATMWSSNPSHIINLEILKTLICKDICTPVFIATLFVFTKIWKQPKFLSMDDWLKKMWYLYTMECYSAIRKDKIMLFATMWMDLENIMPSEINHTGKTSAIWFHSCGT